MLANMSFNRQFALIALWILLTPALLYPLGGAYPDLLQKFAIFSIFAIGFNVLFGLTGYLSFGHAAFLGIGSYTAVWCFKMLTMNAIPAIVLGTLVSGVFALFFGFICLRRSGIYFAIMTLALAQMCYNLAYSVLTPITNGETGLQLNAQDPRYLDAMFGIEKTDALPSVNLFGLTLQGYTGFYFCAFVLIVAFWFYMKIFYSAFGLQLRAIKSNRVRMGFSGYQVRPFLLTAFVISGMYAGLAGSMLAVIDPLAGAERMQWTASGEVVLMTILGGAGTLIGPLLGVGIIEYFENIFSSWNYEYVVGLFSFLPDFIGNSLAYVVSLFVGEHWHLTLGVWFVAIIIFMPGGVIEGLTKLYTRFYLKQKGEQKADKGGQ